MFVLPQEDPFQSLLGRQRVQMWDKGSSAGVEGVGIRTPWAQGTSLLLGCSPSPSPGRLCSHKSTPCRWEEKAVLLFLKGVSALPASGNTLRSKGSAPLGCAGDVPAAACGSWQSAQITPWLGQDKILQNLSDFPPSMVFWGLCTCAWLGELFV